MTVGQASVEFLFAIGMILMIFILALLIIGQQLQQKDFLEASDQALEQCHFLSTAISSVSSAGSGTEKTVEIKLDANILNGYVIVESYICKIEADPINRNLQKGTIKIFRNGTTIDFNQITIVP